MAICEGSSQILVRNGHRDCMKDAPARHANGHVVSTVFLSAAHEEPLARGTKLKGRTVGGRAANGPQAALEWNQDGTLGVTVCALCTVH